MLRKFLVISDSLTRCFLPNFRLIFCDLCSPEPPKMSASRACQNAPWIPVPLLACTAFQNPNSGPAEDLRSSYLNYHFSQYVFFSQPLQCPCNCHLLGVPIHHFHSYYYLFFNLTFFFFSEFFVFVSGPVFFCISFFSFPRILFSCLLFLLTGKTPIFATLLLNKGSSTLNLLVRHQVKDNKTLLKQIWVSPYVKMRRQKVK